MSYRTAVLVDAHVHLHACFGIPALLDAAAANLSRAACALGSSGPVTGCLMLAEAAGQTRFQEIRDWAGRETGGWRFRATGEDCSLAAVLEGGGTIILLGGCQVLTRERLEVLALATAARVADGMTAVETLKRCRAAGAITVLPWGLGKWWFDRCSLIRRLIAGEPHPLFLGDNAGRPRRAPRHRIFRMAERRGVRILPGSDPLPFPGQMARIGRYGFLLEGTLDSNFPAASIRQMLDTSGPELRSFGRRSGFFSVCCDQARLRLGKRSRRRAPSLRSEYVSHRG